jgi:APA family basic amino acid/polyamine antiporter
LGTLLVMVLYLVLNAIFLYAAPMADMAGQLDIGVIVAQASFGPSGAMLMGITLSLLLISTVSAMVMAGPRVLQVVGEDFRLFEWLATTNVKGVPARAINMQAVITIIFIVTSSFESVLIFSGFIMGFNTLIAVLGVFVLRFRSSDEENKKVSYLTWGYPVTPLIYIGIMLWTLFFIVKNRPEEAAVGLFVIASGLIFYWLSRFLGSYKR